MPFAAKAKLGPYELVSVIVRAAWVKCIAPAIPASEDFREGDSPKPLPTLIR